MDAFSWTGLKKHDSLILSEILKDALAHQYSETDEKQHSFHQKVSGLTFPPFYSNPSLAAGRKPIHHMISNAQRNNAQSTACDRAGFFLLVYL